jgi:hypothetical protein
MCGSACWPMKRGLSKPSSESADWHFLNKDRKSVQTIIVKIGFQLTQ